MVSECIMFFQRTRIPFRASMLGGPKLPVTPAPGMRVCLMPSSGSAGTGTHMDTHTQIHIIKKYIKQINQPINTKQPSHYHQTQISKQASKRAAAGLVAHAYKSRTWEATAEGLSELDQPGLYGKFKESPSYILRTCG